MTTADRVVPDSLRRKVIYHQSHNHIWRPVMNAIHHLEYRWWDTGGYDAVLAIQPMLGQIKALKGQPLHGSPDRPYSRDHPHQQAQDLNDVLRTLHTEATRRMSSNGSQAAQTTPDVLLLLTMLTGESKRLIAEVADHDHRDDEDEDEDEDEE